LVFLIHSAICVLKGHTLKCSVEDLYGSSMLQAWDSGALGPNPPGTDPTLFTGPCQHLQAHASPSGQQEWPQVSEDIKFVREIL